MTNSTSLPLIDWNALQALSDGDKAFEVELLKLFVSDTSSHLAKLEDAVQAADIDQARRLAHHLKGASANVGALRFSEIAGTLETEARQEDLSNGDRLTQQLKGVFAEIKELIEA